MLHSPKVWSAILNKVNVVRLAQWVRKGKYLFRDLIKIKLVNSFEGGWEEAGNSEELPTPKWRHKMNWRQRAHPKMLGSSAWMQANPPPSPTPGSSAISFYYSYFKGTVSIISSDPPCKDDNVRFTTVPLKPLEDIVVFLGFRVLSSDNSSKSCCHLDITLTVPLMILWRIHRF